MSQLVITSPIPHIDTVTVKKGMSVCFRPPGGPDYDGFVETIAARSVTLRAYNNTTGKTETVTLTAQQLKGDEYEYFRFSEHLGEIETEGSTPWTHDVDLEIIDPDVCKTQYFIEYDDAHGNHIRGLIGNVSEGSVSVTYMTPAAKALTVVLTVANIKAEGFEATVSDRLGGASETTIYISPEVQ